MKKCILIGLACLFLILAGCNAGYSDYNSAAETYFTTETFEIAYNVQPPRINSLDELIRTRNEMIALSETRGFEAAYDDYFDLLSLDYIFMPDNMPTTTTFFYVASDGVAMSGYLPGGNVNFGDFSLWNNRDSRSGFFTEMFTNVIQERNMQPWSVPGVYYEELDMLFYGKQFWWVQDDYLFIMALSHDMMAEIEQNERGSMNNIFDLQRVYLQ